MPAYKLIYFESRGRAEMTRLVFAAAGVKYEDCRLTREEFEKLKASGKLPFNMLPVLEIDGEILSQSTTILKYVARETGFAPTESLEVAKADMVVDAFSDLAEKMVKVLHAYEANEETKETLKAAFFEKELPHSLEAFENILKSRGGKYFADNKLTYADIIFFSILELLFQDTKEDIPPILENYPTLKDLYTRVFNNPGIKKWLNDRPALDVSQQTK